MEGVGRGGEGRCPGYLSECEIYKKICTVGTSKPGEQTDILGQKRPTFSGEGSQSIVRAGPRVVLVNITLSIPNCLNYLVICMVCT